MKSKKLDRKLNLNKSDVTNLEHNEQSKVKGGYLPTNHDQMCPSWSPYPGCYTQPCGCEGIDN